MGRRMRGAEDAEERGAEGAEWSGVWGRNCCKMNVIFAHFAAFCEDYDSLRLMTLTS